MSATPTSLRSGRRRVAWHVATAVRAALAGAGLTLLAVLCLPPLFGYRPLAVLSGSMEPAIHTGDLVVSRRIAPGRARVGDVVTFREPGRSRMITHRLRSVQIEGATAKMVTKGDANDAPERWSVAAGGTIGRVELRLPRLGFVALWINSPYGRVGLIAVPALLLLAWELALIWRPGRAGGEAGAH